ncbi:MAG: hypothetical protein E6K54_03405 [Gammaproteobacteria bacterium]|nr:MAG: hypothetical protein E6K54_03405 [Gammaproteobacteria bacterium]
MTTITTPRSNQIKSVKNLKNHNEKISLLGTLKKVSPSFRTSELRKLIDDEKEKLETPKWGIALKAIIILFPKEERYNALKLLKNNFDIQLTGPQIEGIKTCLLEDAAFYKLLPFSQKKFLESFLAQPAGKQMTPARDQKIFKNNANRLNNQKNEDSKQTPQKNFVLKNPIQKPLTRSKNNASKVFKENHFQDFLRKFSCKNKNDQFNLFLQFQQSQPELLKEYLKSTQNIIDLFRCISETSLSYYFKLPSIASAINKANFSWDDVISMLKTYDNQGVYLLIDHLLTRNKLSETIDIQQLKLLLLGKDFEKRLDFFNLLKIKKFIPSEVTISDIKLVELFPNLEEQLNNSRQQQSPLFFWNKAFKRGLSLDTIEEECDESKKFKSASNQYLSRRI